MNTLLSSKPLFYSSVERSLQFVRLDEVYRRTYGPSLLIISLDEPLEVLNLQGHKHLSYSLLIPSEAPVTIKTSGAKAVICYLKSTGSDFKQLIPLMTNSIKVGIEYTFFSNVKYEDILIKQAKKVWHESPNAFDVLQQLESLINCFDALHDKNINYQVDARVEKVIAMIKANFTENVSVNAMAKAVGLSSSRLSQLFREATGSSIRRLRLWERVFFTARCLQSGMSLTEAAAMAGFADYGQFFRVYNEMGGRLPGKAKLKTVIKAC